MAYRIKQGSLLPTYVVELHELVGTPADRIVPNLDTAFKFHFRMKLANAPDEDLAVIEDAGFNTNLWVDPADPDAYTGSVEHVWQDGETEQPDGDYSAEIGVEWVEGKIEWFPNEGFFSIKVTPNLKPGNE